MEDSMNSILRLVTVVAGLVLLLNVTPSWGQPTCVAPGCNPTTSDGSGNTAGGTNALKTVAGGSNNTAFGLGALQLNITGGNNTSIGWQALVNNTSGSGNTATGTSALFINTDGGNNTAIGNNALEANNGSNNTATGFNALAQNAGGTKNTAMGVSTLTSNLSGNSNTAMGYIALAGNSVGAKNTAVGFKALNLSTGSQNIGIGSKAGIHLQSGNNNIYLGSPGDPGVSTESLTMRLGGVQQTTFIAGINTATVSDATVNIDTITGQLGIATSSARYKRDIAPMGAQSEKVLDLRPVTFAYKEDAHHVKHYGLIAEEVATVYPELVTHTATGEVQAVRYQELIPMLLNEVQRQRQAIKLQEQQLADVAALRNELAELRALVGQGRETASLAR
jgi:endosialidase-like protein